MASKKSKKASKSKAPTLSKSAFIRKYPALSATKVAEQAKRAGLDVDPSYVYVVRSADRNKEKPQEPAEPSLEEFWDLTRPGRSALVDKPSKSKGPKVAQGGPPGVTPSNTDSLEAQFVRLIMELGIARATVLFKKTLMRLKGLAG